jgi:hypothetical protein
MEKACRGFLGSKVGAYKNLPVGSIAIALPAPVNGEPSKGVREPVVWSTLKTQSDFPDPSFTPDDT